MVLHMVIHMGSGLQAQVLSAKEAEKRLGGTKHSKDASMPLMFFGTLEIAWLQPRDTLPWAAGCSKGHHRRQKPAALVSAVDQVGIRIGQNLPGRSNVSFRSYCRSIARLFYSLSPIQPEDCTS